MTRIHLAATALLLAAPPASRAFMTAKTTFLVHHASSTAGGSSLNQHQYGDEQYYAQGQQQNDDYQQQPQQFYDAEGNPISQQFYDAEGNPIYTYDPTQQYEQDPQLQQQYQQQQASEQYDNINYSQEQPSALITGNIQEEMVKATSGVELGGMDYLALARERAAQRTASNNSGSTEADWHQFAEEKRKVTSAEDWENSWPDEEGEEDVWDNSSESGGSDDTGTVNLVEGGGGVMMTDSGLVIDSNAEGGDGPQLLI